MKTGRKYEGLLRESVSDGGLLHFQLCHRCLYLNESSQEISACKKCGKPFVEADVPTFHEDVQVVTPEDPFAEWDSDDDADEQVGVWSSEEDDEDGDEDDWPSPQKKRNPFLNGLRVRW